MDSKSLSHTKWKFIAIAVKKLKLIFRKQKSNKEETKAWYPCSIK